ncbi:MAG: hypothetical protein AB1531_02045 [Chloroflexota bacterium]
MSFKRISIIVGALLVLAAILVACSPKATPTAAVEESVSVDSVPFYALWSGSGHADTTAEAFNHWNEDDPAVVPVECARCHAPAGYLDYLGVDSSPAGTVEAEVAAPAGVVSCTTCHNDATRNLTSVTFPSGVTVTGLGPEARCMVCHQGRASKLAVDEKIAGLEVDTVSADLGFTNIHYFAAAATLYGSEVHGGYEYEGMAYDFKHDHVTGVDTCVACHDSHTLQVKLETCQFCHQEVSSVEDLRDVREPSSAVDYDGDGNITEGMYYEIEGLQQALYTAIQSYANEVSGAAIIYSADAYPYFFADADGNGTIDEGEGKYTSWTPRLLKAAYNLQLSVKDPGAFAHGNKYIVQLLFDSIADLNTQLSTPVDMSLMHRDDAGHFAGNTEAFRHWDEDGGIVPNTCVRCHTSTGLPMFLENNGSTIAQSASNGFQCSTCHDEANWPDRYVVNEVTMPSGAKVSFGEGADSNLCIECHQGRSSGPTLAAAIGTKPLDTVDEKLKFVNVHYFAAGATLFGNEAKGMYQFADKTYAGQNMHPESMGSTLNFCTACHDQHALTIDVATCATCHQGITDPLEIRAATDTVDYDGDGNVAEPLYQEITSMADALYAAIQTYAAETAGTPLLYSTDYPYVFADANGNGQVDEDENSYATWTPRLLIAAYNYQYFQKDPGAFAHNGKYVIQVLYDTIEFINGDVTGMTRP